MVERGQGAAGPGCFPGLGSGLGGDMQSAPIFPGRWIDRLLTPLRGEVLLVATSRMMSMSSSSWYRVGREVARHSPAVEDDDAVGHRVHMEDVVVDEDAALPFADAVDVAYSFSLF